MKMNVCDVTGIPEDEDFPVLVYEQQLNTYREISRNQPAKELLGDTPLTETLLEYDGEGIAAFIQKRRQQKLSVLGRKGDVVFSVALMPCDGYRICTLQDVSCQYRRSEKIVEEARAASRAKTSFLSEMSHDIRTPMNAIIGMTDIAVSQKDIPSSVRHCLENIQTASEHMMSLLDQVLDISRIESGRVVIHKRKLVIADMVHAVMAVVAPQAKARKEKFIFRTGELAAECIMADGVRLKQIFLNLLSNAIKFTPEGGSVEFFLSVLREKNGVLMKAQITDTGIGMTPEFLDRIFLPFEREQSSVVDKTQGTGLGMTIVKSLVELMEGSIRVQSRKGDGTSFTLEIPFQPAEQNRGHVREVFRGRERKQEPQTIDLRGRHLMLVEDNAINREIAMTMLADTHVQITPAENGRQAVELFQNSKQGEYDLILMDIQMPVMDGLDAAREIRRLDRADSGTIPIVAMTANAFVEDMQHSREAGMNAHISKPVDRKCLFSCLYRFLGTQGNSFVND